jgi:hypothetical protein
LALIAYIDQSKEQFGVEPICCALTAVGAKIAPSTYYAAAHARPPSARAVGDEQLKGEIVRVHEANLASTASARSGVSRTGKASRSPAAGWSG